MTPGFVDAAAGAHIGLRPPHRSRVAYANRTNVLLLTSTALLPAESIRTGETRANSSLLTTRLDCAGLPFRRSTRVATYSRDEEKHTWQLEPSRS